MYQVTINDFEGPMDLLLHLIKTHDMDIMNITRNQNDMSENALYKGIQLMSH